MPALPASPPAMRTRKLTGLRARSRSSTAFRPAVRPMWSRASSPTACRKRSASRSSSSRGTGASGTTAAAFVARAAPDGYTLEVIPSGHASAAATFAHLPYRSIDDFTMITLASEYPYVMCTNATSGIKTVAELLDAARTRPAPLLYGTPGVGSGPHLAIELFALKTKIKVAARALPRQRAGDHRTRRRPARLHDGPSGEPDRLHPQRQAQRARGLQLQTATSPCPIRRPLRKAAFPDLTCGPGKD